MFLKSPNALGLAVSTKNLRPSWPDGNEMSPLVKAAWSVAESCWSHDPSMRPKITVVRERLEEIEKGLTSAM